MKVTEGKSEDEGESEDVGVDNMESRTQTLTPWVGLRMTLGTLRAEGSGRNIVEDMVRGRLHGEMGGPNRAWVRGCVGAWVYRCVCRSMDASII